MFANFTKFKTVSHEFSSIIMMMMMMMMMMMIIMIKTSTGFHQLYTDNCCGQLRCLLVPTLFGEYNNPVNTSEIISK